MTTYIYETIEPKPGEKRQYFEIKQSMTEAALTKHPETGVPIRRVILGGFGLLKKDGGTGSSHSHSNSCGCGPSGCC